MFILIFSLFFLTSHSGECAFRVDGKNYDLTPLMKLAPFTDTDGVAHHEDIVGDTTYTTMGVCANNANSAHCSNPALVTQFTDTQYTNCLSTLAYWNSSVQAQTLQDMNEQYTGHEGFSLTFNNGDYCDIMASNRLVTINYICDKSKEAERFEISENPMCTYKINFHSKYACATTSNNSSDGSSSGLSGGWIFIILLICTLVVYCGGGIFYNHKYTENEGTELIPNLEFWKQVPGWVKIGCCVSFEWTKETVEKLRKGEDKIEEIV